MYFNVELKQSFPEFSVQPKFIITLFVHEKLIIISYLFISRYMQKKIKTILLYMFDSYTNLSF